jgi:hypothetical protein
MTAAAALLLFAGLLSFFCLTPLDLCFRAEQADTFSLDVRATWLFGLVQKRFRTGGRTGKRASADHGTSSRGRSAGGRRRALLAALGTSGFSARLLRLAGDLLHSLLPRDVSVRIEGGLEDPAATGMACAAVAALSPGLRGIPHLRIEWRPDFNRRDLTGEAAAEFRLVPAKIIWPSWSSSPWRE